MVEFNPLEKSVVLTDTAGIGRNRIEAALTHLMPHHHWIDRSYDNSHFLIEAPNPLWFSDSDIERLYSTRKY
jgi:hypothetical protein